MFNEMLTTEENAELNRRVNMSADEELTADEKEIDEELAEQNASIGRVLSDAFEMAEIEELAETEEIDMEVATNLFMPANA